MNSFRQHLKWQLVIISRNNLINISIAVTSIYALIFYLIKDVPNSDKYLTLLIFNDPAIICLFFVAISVILEKNQQVLPALFATPMSHQTYIIAKVIALSLVGFACASGMTVAMLGASISWINFIIGVVGICIICSLFGLIIVSYSDEFLAMTIRAIPVMFLLALPLLNYFELAEISLFNLMPTYGALELLINSYAGDSKIIDLIPEVVSMVMWIVLLYYLAVRTFLNKVKWAY